MDEEKGMYFDVSYTSCPDPHMIWAKQHIHQKNEILYVIKGDVSYCIDGFKFSVKKHDVIFIPANTYHFLIPEGTGDYENYGIYVDSDGFDKGVIEKLFGPPYVLNIADDAPLREMYSFFKIYKDTFSPEDYTAAAYNNLNQMLIYASYKKKENTGCKTLVSRISGYIIENLDKNINASDIAKHFNFTTSYLQNLFSREMGIGIKAYINQKKIYAACSDIRNGISPLEAAEKYSYKNYSSFYRQYMKNFGISPKCSKKKQ